MTLTPVESSHIAAIGYLEDERVLLVRYKDGALYAWPEFQALTYESLSDASSKGKWMATWIRRDHGIPITKGVMSTDPTTGSDSAASPGGNVAPSPGELTWLHVIDEDADACCRKSLAKSFAQFPAASIMSCGQCGQEFTPVIVGPNKLWRCVQAFGVYRGRR